jgi:hypothetical protein
MNTNTKIGQHNRAFANRLNAFLFLVLAISGLILISFHGGRHSLETSFFGFDRGMWRNIHIFSAFACLPCFSLHLFYQRKWLKVQFSKFFSMVRDRQLISRLVVAVTLLTLLTGMVGFFMGIAGSGFAGHVFDEIHDKLGLMFIIITFIHIRYNVVLAHKKRRVLAKESE